jgi:ATP-dependent helicase IRC3
MHAVGSVCLGARRNLSSAPGAIILRPYQEACLLACTDALRSGISRIGVSLPTGAGKTTVFISLLSRISPPPRRTDATRSLIIVNSVELARQAASQVEALFPRWTVELEQGVNKASGLADVYAFAIHCVLCLTHLLPVDELNAAPLQPTKPCFSQNASRNLILAI